MFLSRFCPSGQSLRRWLLLIVVFAVGVASASLWPGLSQSLRKTLGFASAPRTAQVRADTSEQPRPNSEPADEKQQIKLTEEQISGAQIDLVAAQSARLARRIVVPGTIIPASDRIARVSVKLSGMVAELRKKPGDPVAKDEVLAVLESREVADAKSEYLAARLGNELQQELFFRDKKLWEGRVLTEQQFLRARNLTAQTEMKFNIARQKLFALGLTDPEIAALPTEPEALLRRQEVRSPMTGRIAERKVDLGTVVGRDNLETELFVVVDLDRVWLDLAASPADLPLVKEGQRVTVTARGVKDGAEGRIVFISPLLDKETRAARVVAEIANSDGGWRPGSFVTAAIAVEEQSVPLAVPTSAIQTIGGDKVVFVRTAEGFEKRPVVLGRDDGRLTEIATGLKPGEIIAATNTFPLKAEFLKGQTED
jgi:cobalt-zinc-cadmium efflux system membrane fusion protein